MDNFLVFVSLFLCASTRLSAKAQDGDGTLQTVLERLLEVEQKQRLNENIISKLSTTIEQRTELLAVLEERNTMLEEQLDKEQKRFCDLQDQVSTIRRTLASIHKRFVKAGNADLGLSVSGKHENHMEKRQCQEGVAFTAYLDHAGEYGTGQTIKFNKIVTNEGSAYNVHTGVFTCLQSGLYLFSFAAWQRMEGTSSRGVYLNLKVNDQPIVDAAVDTFHDTQDLQGGNTAVIRLIRGDAVWVSSHSPVHIHGGSHRATSFTGVYLNN